MKKFKLLIVFYFFIANCFVFAQNKTEEFKAFKAKYSSKEFDYSEIKKVKQNTNYESGPLDRFIDSAFNLLSSLPWKFIFILAIIIFVSLIGYRIYKNGGLLKPNAKKLESDTDFEFIEENLTEVNLDKLIDKAEKEENYPLAIRYLHYQNLQNLHQRNLIEWDPKKTNQQFINQIKDEQIRNQFKENTFIFNQIWFGEFTIDAIKYQEYKSMFNQLNQAIK